MKTKFFLLLPALLISAASVAQTVNVTIDVNQNRKDVSPYIYGKNNSLSDDPSHPLSVAQWQRLKDAGIKLFRENTGNNATKYNWRLKLTSAPDWYNNVYGADWDYEAQSLQQNIPGAKGMYAFQLIGKVAANDDHNFNDWGYNEAAGWPGVAQNLAGGGVVDTNYHSTHALVEGNTDLYLKNWPADSTVAILDKWFGGGAGNLNLDESTFEYWNMDNEPEIWEDTHDDAMPHQLSAEAFMQRYFAVAEKARAKFPNIKLVGFVPCSEWYWYAYPDGLGNSGKISYKGEKYTWVEFFIKRIAEHQDTTGIRLLDVIDLHTYFSVSSEEDLLQAHRIFYDQTYNYPGANGVKLTGPGDWDNSITKEYIFARINTWLTEYLGADHGVTIGSTEFGWDNFNQMPLALNYASTLGVFANEGVELFTPWFWSPSYWEVVHLFSRYSKKISVQSTSDDNNYVSAYSTANASNDSLTIVLVNRYPHAINTEVSLSNFDVTDGLYPTLILNDLPNNNSTETFVSHSNNALKSSYTVVVDNIFSIALPAYSITSVILRTGAPVSDYLGVSPTIIELGDTSGSTEITVFSNVNWTASSNQSWLTLSTASGSNGGTLIATTEANTSSDPRSAIITFSGSGVADQTVTVNQTAPQFHATEDMVIYNDNETLIQGIWGSAGTLAEITTGAFEGSKHYQFNYSLSNWWSGFGLNLTNWGGDDSGYDFSEFESLKFACRMTGPSSATISLLDADNSTATNEVTIDGISSAYQDFTIPLTAFTGMDLSDISEININLNGSNATGTGVFDIDNIRLAANGSATANPQIQKQAETGHLMNYPNPFSLSTTILFETTGTGRYKLTIYDLTGREVAVLISETLSAGMHTVNWDGTNSNGNRLAGGLYLVQLRGENGTMITKEVVLIN